MAKGIDIAPQARHLRPKSGRSETAIEQDHLDPQTLYQAHVVRRNQHVLTRPVHLPDCCKIIVRKAEVDGLRPVHDGGRFIVQGAAGGEDGGLQVIVSPASPVFAGIQTPPECICLNRQAEVLSGFSVEEAAVDVVAEFTGEVKEAEWLGHGAGGCERSGALGGSWGLLDDGWE